MQQQIVTHLIVALAQFKKKMCSVPDKKKLATNKSIEAIGYNLKQLPIKLHSIIIKVKQIANQPERRKTKMSYMLHTNPRKKPIRRMTRRRRQEKDERGDREGNGC